MDVRGIDHVAVAVADLDGAARVLEAVLGLRVARRERVEEYGVEVASIPTASGVDIELVAPLSDDSGVARWLARRGPGIHHVALRVDDVAAALGELAARGVRTVDAEPRPGREGTRVAFLHPESTARVLFELVERPAQERSSEPADSPERASASDDDAPGPS